MTFKNIVGGIEMEERIQLEKLYNVYSNKNNLSKKDLKILELALLRQSIDVLLKESEV